MTVWVLLMMWYVNGEVTLEGDRTTVYASYEVCQKAGQELAQQNEETYVGHDCFPSEYEG